MYLYRTHANSTMSHFVGQLALNVAFILYLLHYLPQLHHNRDRLNLQSVSLHFHGLLLISYLCDLGYGFGMGLPWQYVTISSMGTLCLLIQHVQLFFIHKTNRTYQLYTVIGFSLSVLVVLELLYSQSRMAFLTLGSISQASAIVFLIPAIIDNARRKESKSLHIGYLSMNLSCYASNFIAAYALNWPLPSQIGTLFGVLCVSILIAQYNFYRKHSPLPLASAPSYPSSTL
jgi:uncharacterized protein with PQ loop repeat